MPSSLYPVGTTVLFAKRWSRSAEARRARGTRLLLTYKCRVAEVRWRLVTFCVKIWREEVEELEGVQLSLACPPEMETLPVAVHLVLGRWMRRGDVNW